MVQADASGEFVPLLVIAVVALLGLAAVADAPTSDGHGGVNYGSADPMASVGAMAAAAQMAMDPLMLPSLICGSLIGGGGAKDPERSEPKTYEEQVAMENAKNGAPGATPIMEGKINDPAYKDSHVKMKYTMKTSSGETITIHFWRDRISGVDSGLKFKLPAIGKSPLLNGPIVEE